jgi:hypothetical protein
MILQCINCKPNEFQDKLYGKNHRVHNVLLKDRKPIGYRCSICGNVNKSKVEEPVAETKK